MFIVPVILALLAQVVEHGPERVILTGTVVGPDGRVEGILTEGDLLRRSEIATEKRHWPWLDFLLGPGRMASDYVKTHGRVCDELMSDDVISVAPDAPLAEIVALMERRRIKRVPVIENGALLCVLNGPAGGIVRRIEHQHARIRSERLQQFLQR